MNVMLSLCLWFALMLSSCCGDAGSHEEETTTADYDYQTVTATEDYDYTATFDYYYVTGIYPEHVHNKASWISGFSPVLLLGLAVYHIWN